MNGDNPGVYDHVEQTAWWPFIPALGLIVGVSLLVIFVLTAVMAMKRDGSGLWAAASGLLAIVILGSSIVGCAAAASQYEQLDRANHDRYVAEVARWVSDEVGAEIAASDAARLLDGEALTASIGGELSDLSIEQDRHNDLLKLVVR